MIVLAYSDDLDVQQADARSLVTLLHLRDIAERTGGEFTIVSELLDPDTPISPGPPTSTTSSCPTR